jgi:hypothetical protein
MASDLLLVRGDKEIDWPVFVLGILLSTVLRTQVMTGFSKQLASIFQVAAMRTHDKDNPQDRDVLTLLNRFRSFKATDPRDKVFALFGRFGHGRLL